MHGKELYTGVGAAIILASLIVLMNFSLATGTSVQNPVPRSVSASHSATRAFVIPSKVRKVESQQFSGATDVYDVGSIGHEVLSAIVLNNGSYALVLSNMKTNTSRNLGVTPGGSVEYPNSVVGAGGKFFVSFLNDSTLASTVEVVSTSGTVSVPSLKFPNNGAIAWQFVYGNSTVLYASAPGALAEFNPTTYALINPFSTYYGVLDAFAVLPVGHLLYLAGWWQVASTASLYFGAYNTTTNTTKLLLPIKYYATNVYGQLTSIAMQNGYVYVGGGTFYYQNSPLNTSSLAGLLFRYSPTTGTVTNLSAHLRSPKAWAYALEPFKSGLFVYTAYYAQTTTTSVATCDVYVSYSSTNWVNLTSSLPRNFLAEFYPITSESGGFVYMGGGNTLSDLAEVVAIQT